MPAPIRQIDRLIKYAGVETKIFKEVWHNGQDWSFYMQPLTIADKQRATKNSDGGDSQDFALHLLCSKALDEDGQAQFNAAADLPRLRNIVQAACLDKLMLAILQDGEEVEEETDMKSSSAATTREKRAGS